MMDCTDRFCRYFLRLISKHCQLYTEMVTTGALLHGDHLRFLEFDQSEHPIGLQLGGNDPAELAACARLAEECGYDEVNLNCGCPSDRVRSGRFGASLMLTPDLVADAVAAMRAASPVPVTVKHRIGVDDHDSYQHICDFVGMVAAAGCRTFIVHARKAWLAGLSPKQNREIPPLEYAMVYRLKKDFPELEIIINGGITTLDEVEDQLQRVDGVMIGREAYQNPYLLAGVDQRFYGDSSEAPSRLAILEDFIPFVREELSRGTRLHLMTRHLMGLFKGQPGARRFRRHLTEKSQIAGSGIEALERAIMAIPARTEERYFA